METAGFVLSTAQVVYIAGAVRRHLEAISSLDQLIRAVERKSIHCCDAAKRMSLFAGIPGTSGLVYQLTHTSTQEIGDMLASIQQRVERWETLHILFLQAPALEWELRTMERKLDVVELHFATVSVLGAVITANCTETHEIGVEQNRVAATVVYERCIRTKSDVSGLFQPGYGLRLIQVIGVEKDEARGKALIIDAKNSSFKWFTMGECYRHGIGFEQDKRRAKQFYKKAVECDTFEGKMYAYIALAEMFETGDGVVNDIHRAIKCYLNASDHRQPRAQWKVALAFESGVGLPQNLQRAIFYVEIYANSGNRDALRKCVSYYIQGHGVERSRDSMENMIREAAHDGNWEARC